MHHLKDKCNQHASKMKETHYTNVKHEKTSKTR